MSAIIQNLLVNYYGIGAEETTTRTLSSHEASNHQENSFQKSVSTDLNTNITNEDTFLKNPGLQEKKKKKTRDSDHVDESDGPEDKVLRSWRAIVDDEEVDDEAKPLGAAENILDAQEENRDWVPDVPKMEGVKVISIKETEAREEPTKQVQGNFGLLEEVVQDSGSDVSSLSMTKKPRKRFQIIAPVCMTSQAPVLRYPSLGKVPVYNGEFFDVSNAAITEFPVNLLEKIHGIKMLYLENNALAELPEVLFTILKYLQFLDLRHNRLSSLSPFIKHHQSLETILLQGNQFERLPLELGLIPNLKALQVVDNPLKYPPKSVLELGFGAIMNFLRKEWNSANPDELIRLPKEIKSAQTILCHEPPIQGSSKSSNILNSSSSMDLPKIYGKLSVREKSRNYRPSNRCRSSGPNRFLENRLLWLAKVKEQLNEQAIVLQKTKDREVLKRWRQDHRSFNKSIEKASKRTQEDIPFDIETPLMIEGQLKKLIRPNKDINTRLNEIVTSLKEFGVEKESGRINPSMELSRLQEEIQKLTNLQEEIKNLKIQNKAAILKYEESYKPNQYKALPSIII